MKRWLFGSLVAASSVACAVLSLRAPSVNGPSGRLESPLYVASALGSVAPPEPMAWRCGEKDALALQEHVRGVANLVAAGLALHRTQHDAIGFAHEADLQRAGDAFAVRWSQSPRNLGSPCVPLMDTSFKSRTYTVRRQLADVAPLLATLRKAAVSLPPRDTFLTTDSHSRIFEFGKYPSLEFRYHGSQPPPSQKSDVDARPGAVWTVHTGRCGDLVLSNVDHLKADVDVAFRDEDVHTH